MLDTGGDGNIKNASLILQAFAPISAAIDFKFFYSIISIAYANKGKWQSLIN